MATEPMRVRHSFARVRWNVLLKIATKYKWPMTELRDRIGVNDYGNTDDCKQIDMNEPGIKLNTNVDQLLSMILLRTVHGIFLITVFSIFAHLTKIFFRILFAQWNGIGSAVSFSRHFLFIVWHKISKRQKILTVSVSPFCFVIFRGFGSKSSINLILNLL